MFTLRCIINFKIPLGTNIVSKFTYFIQNQDKKTIYRYHLDNQILLSFKCSGKHKLDYFILKIDPGTSNKMNLCHTYITNELGFNNVLFNENAITKIMNYVLMKYKYECNSM